MTKPTLFLDCDGTLLDTLPAMVRYINQRYGINSVMSDYLNSPPLNTIINRYLPPEQSVSVGEAYIDLDTNFLSSHECHETILPIEGVTKIIPLLAQRYDMWIVTARHQTSHSVLAHMVERHMRGCITGIHCVWKHLGGTELKETSKKDFIARFPGEKVGFIDDTVGEVLKVGSVIPSYLFDPSGFNAHRTDVRHKVQSWTEIGEIFLN